LNDIVVLPDVEPPALPLAPPDPPLVMAMAKAFWTAYQTKFSGGHIPAAGEWERRIAHLDANPGLGQPFEDAAIEGARRSFILVMNTLRRGAI
jgi:hypothetical protein